MEEVTNQSDIVETAPIETNTEVQTEPVTTQETVTEPKGIKVKYNKEDRFVPEEELPTWVQKGLNYDKVQQQLEETKQQAAHLDRIAKFHGFENQQEYLQALEQAELEDRANKENMDPEFLKRLELLENENKEARQIKEQHQQQQSYQEFRNNTLVPFAKEKGADADALEQFMTEHQVYSLDIAHDAMRARELEAKYAEDIKKTEAETIKKIQQNALTSPGAASQGDVDHSSNFAQLTKEEQRRMIEEVKQGKRTSFN